MSILADVGSYARFLRGLHVTGGANPRTPEEIERDRRAHDREPRSCAHGPQDACVHCKTGGAPRGSAAGDPVERRSNGLNPMEQA